MIHPWRWRRALEALHDGSLAGPRRQALERHLARCAACAAELARLEETDRLLRAARPGTGSLPDAAAAAIFERAVIQSGILRRPAARRWLLCAAGLPVSAALALLATHGERAPATPPSPEPHPPARVVSFPPAPQASPVSHPRGNLTFKPVRSRLALHRTSRYSAPRLAWRPARLSHRRGRRGPAPHEILLAHGEPVSPDVEAPPQPALPAVETPPGGTLLVVMTAGDPQPTCEAQARVAPPETPGFARVVACQTGANGERIRVQVTVSSETSVPQVLLQAAGEGEK